MRHFAMLLLALAPLSASAAEAKRVLILDSFGRDVAPFNVLRPVFKTDLAQHAVTPVEFFEIALEAVRPGEVETDAEQPLVAYLRGHFAPRQLDLIVPVGGLAMGFWLRHRATLFADVPVLIAGIDQRRARNVALSAGETVVAAQMDLPAAVANILRVLPETTSIVVILGQSPLEQFWVAEARREWQPFEDRVQFIWLNELSFEDMRKRAASLPPHSALLYGMLAVDAAGVPHEQERALTALHAEASAPLFGLFENQLGLGIVGGPLLDVEQIGRETARVAIRILEGERPGNLETAPVRPGPPRYDWRELQRWRIDQAVLSPESVVLYRVPSQWEEHRWLVITALVIVGTQALAIAGLVVQRARRRRAESEARRLRQELLHATRVSTIGELSASLAHELSQPLTAILRNAETAELLLHQHSPDVEQLRDIVRDIRSEDKRAGAVIDRLRALLKKRSLESHPVAVAELFSDVVELTRADGHARGVKIEADASPEPLRVTGDRVHLAQVLLNLVINAMDAMDDGSAGDRRVTLQARRDGTFVEMSVRDSGRGIPDDDLGSIFRPFHTSKPDGMGMGLAIARTVIEAHGGRVWAKNNAGRGATFRLTVPEAGGHPTSEA